MKTIFLTVLLSCSITMAFGQNKVEVLSKKDFSIGESIAFKSKILNEDRTINIYLPNGYGQEEGKTYPVIYLLDGSRDEDFIHIAGLVQFGSFSWINMLPETIVVGIGNVDRKRDFTYPTNNKRDKKDYPTTGESATFISFIEQELQPFIDNIYPTNDTKTIIGQSLGGLLATEILYKKPNLFDHYIIISPSLWWDDESLLKEELSPSNAPQSVYVGVGKEGKVMERVAKELHQKLSSTFSDNTHLFFKFLEEQDHGDALHLGVYDAFEKIFKAEED